MGLLQAEHDLRQQQRGMRALALAKRNPSLPRAPEPYFHGMLDIDIDSMSDAQIEELLQQKWEEEEERFRRDKKGLHNMYRGTSYSLDGSASKEEATEEESEEEVNAALELQATGKEGAAAAGGEKRKKKPSRYRGRYHSDWHRAISDEMFATVRFTSTTNDLDRLYKIACAMEKAGIKRILKDSVRAALPNTRPSLAPPPPHQTH